MKTKTVLIFALILLTALVGFAALIYFTLPINRVGLRSDLVMLGDLDNNRKWDSTDRDILQAFLKEPFSFTDMDVVKIDANRNQLIDSEDLKILDHLYTYSDPYQAESKAYEQKLDFPRPRELFIYIPKTIYTKRPLFSIKHDSIDHSPLTFLKEIPLTTTQTYRAQILHEIYNEGVRATLAFNKRKPSLNDIEKTYSEQKIQHCIDLYSQGEYNNLLLNLIGFVEDAETLTITGQSEFVYNLLFLRDALKELLLSRTYNDFLKGQLSYQQILEEINSLLKQKVKLVIEVDKLPPPRDFLKLSNYVDRTEWQYYKSSSKLPDFEQLLLFAQHDPRYLRTVSKTSRRNTDITVENHNLPMILLFREALRIKANNKKAAVGLLDETIRLPFSWIKTIPKETLPSSIALENFLLPGNKEDGSDKSRHWNVFGGLSLYRSPEESLTLALSREIKDLKEDNFSTHMMTEFIRDTIANINGIYYVMSIQPNLIYGK